jgi:hypothetical protein
MDWPAGVRFPVVQNVSFLHNVQIHSRTHPPIHWVQTDLSLWLKHERREADHSPTSSVEVKNGGAIPPLPQVSSWHSALTQGVLFILLHYYYYYYYLPQLGLHPVAVILS